MSFNPSHARTLIYVAGRFSAPTREGVEANIHAAALVGLEVAKLGACPVVPHSNTSLPEYEDVQPYQFWIEATMEMLRRCNGVVLVPGWEESSGARGEVAEAQRLGLPVFRTLAELEHWLRPSLAGDVA